MQENNPRYKYFKCSGCHQNIRVTNIRVADENKLIKVTCPKCGRASYETYSSSQQSSQENPPKKKRPWVWIIVAIIALFLVYEHTDIFGGARDDVPQYQEVPADVPQYQDTPVLTPEQIFEENADSAFMIREYTGDGRVLLGSGFFVCSTGVAVTNHHVIVGLINPVALMHDGREFEIIGYYSYDIGNDYAIIQVDGEGAVFQYVSFGVPDDVRIEDEITVISSPAGVLNTLLYGQLLGRPQRVDFGCATSGIIYTVFDPLQHSANTTGGSSGGAVFNDSGEVVGVHAAGDRAVPGVGFAVPASRVTFEGVTRGEFRPLPLRLPTAQAAFFYHAFPDVPTFGSVVDAARFLIGMPIFEAFPLINGGRYMGHIHSYDYLFAYELPCELVDSGLNAYSEVLLKNGFIFQGEVLYFYYGALHSDGKFFKFVDDGLSEGYSVEDLDESFDFGAFLRSMAYFYNADEDVSLVLNYDHFDDDGADVVKVMLGRGNVYEDYEGVENFIYPEDFEDFLGDVYIGGSVREDGLNAIAITDEYLDGVMGIDEAIERIRRLERDDWSLLGDVGPLYHLIWQISMSMEFPSWSDSLCIISSRNMLARVLDVPER
ncbi:MAG: S1C family serine protease [Oscillospiraceae bacterium]|nr:S1C family serine protease [Oscillospiraceae bacterium]